MSHQKSLQLMIGMTLVILFLVGCNVPVATLDTSTTTPTPELPTATSTLEPPTATPTSEPPAITPTPLSGPKAGHWEGSSSVSFEITADGNISDFRAVIPFSPSTCTIKFEEIVVEADGAFIIPDSLEKPESPNEKIEDDHIYGKFTDATTISGTYKFGLYRNNFVIPASEDTWSAEWKGHKTILLDHLANKNPAPINVASRASSGQNSLA